MTTFSRATIAIATIYGPQEVQAMVRGGLAVHGSAGLYTVSHIASGKAVCHSDQQRTAKGIAVELLDKFDQWQQGEDELRWVEPELARWLAEMVIAKPAPKPKPIVAPPLELEPIYPDYFSPSDRLREIDEHIVDFVWHAGHNPKLGQCGPGLAEDVSAAAELQQREMIMARFAAGKRATISEADVPIKGLVVYALPPGIEPGYAGVAQLTKQMWKLGKEIDEAAKKMIQVFGESFRASEDDKLYDFPVEGWLAKDDEFSALVQSGWCDWAIAVNLFSQLSAAERKKVTDVLGFVGSDEQGWHAFGAKTFLRSKRLPELLRCRRAVQEALNG